MAPHEPLSKNSRILNKVIARIALEMLFYRYSSKTVGDRDLKLLPMPLVNLEAPSIFSYEKDTMSPSRS